MARKATSNAYDGFLSIDKDRGPTSHDVVAILRRMLGMRRIGHCGTLDPLASGVLVICLGTYTRLSGVVSASDKEYEATFVLGSTSATGDAEGPISPVGDAPVPTTEQVLAHVGRFRGVIDQVPHAYSAVKVKGTPSYRLARRDETTDLEPRQIRIEVLDVVRYDYPEVEVRLVCSKGTYVRSLATDLGKSLASGAYVKRLRRVRVGQLDLPMALSLDAVDVAVKKERLKEHFVNPRVALAALPQVFLTSGQALPFSQGRRANIDSNETAEAGAECAVFAVDETGEKLAGIGKRLTSREIQPLKVLIQPRMAARDSERSEMEEITFSGVVEHGEGRGAELGFPTANLKLEDALLARLPRGVFAATVLGEQIGGEQMGVVNIGTRPTFAKGETTVELHILEFSGVLYGQTLEVSLAGRLRDERRFENVQSLVSQLHRDVEDAKSILGRKVRPRQINQLQWRYKPVVDCDR